MSCDLEPTETLGAHYQGNVMDVINDGWDLMIAHPPCTHLAVSGARHFAKKIADGRQQQGIDFFMALANSNIPRYAIENPIGIMSSKWRKPDQIINPWEYGHSVTKATCLWLKGLPLLKPTNVVEKGEIWTAKSGKRMSQWYYDSSCLQPKEREKMRNKTFQGIADAMAEQWGNYSEEWRNECEARELLTWPLANRRKQLDLIAQKRGWDAMLKLRDEMERQWKLARTKQLNLSSNNQESLQKPKQIELI